MEEMSDDYYQLLGLDKTCSDNDIKKAYRKLAVKYHPDKCKGIDKEKNTLLFQKITEAYEILSNPKKKQMYDKFGKNAFSQGDMSEVNPFDIFNNIFNSGGFQMNDMSDFQEFNMREFHGMPGMSGIPGMSGVNIRVGGSGFSRQRQSSNIQKIIEITLEESYTGLKKNIEFSRTVNNTKKNTNLQIDIPKGSLNNTKLIKKGYGNEEKGLPPGNLEIIINIKEHDVFKVSDNHLVIIQNIKYGTSLLGTKFYVRLLNGDEINININGPIFDNDIRAIKGHGLPKLNSNNYGDLVIKFSVEKQLYFTKEQIKVISQVFPLDKFNIGDCREIDAVNPESFQQDDDEQQVDPRVQCAQQ